MKARTAFLNLSPCSRFERDPAQQRYPDNVEKGSCSVVKPCEGAPTPFKPIKDWHTMGMHQFVIQCRLGGGLQGLGCHPETTVTAKYY